ncbi:MAG: M20/M25/M40 family metallo-hydrolase [Gemmatimonadales bacterium]|nr:M20/M25/M40 family metallo-hydrolase [Gemmatimonadales bacterium]
MKRDAQTRRRADAPVARERDAQARRRADAPVARVGALALVLVLSVLAPGRLTAQQDSRIAEARDVIRRLVESYGVSGHEGPVRETVIRLLPDWANPTIDSAGNVQVRVGQGAPLVVFVAHMDEIGFVVTAIRDDGQLELRRRGGFFTSLYEGEPALVHTAQGIVPAVFTPRDSVGPSPRRTPPVPLVGGRPDTAASGFRVDPGTGSRAGTDSLGIRVGDAITMPKQYVSLAGNRATGRSFDDRVGCAAQILALRRLDSRRLRHSVLFIFSTREEVGLEGARFAAQRLGGEPIRVHALDTFVSSDAPLEIKTFANALVGRGAVARAVDNSSVTPPALLDSLAALARARRIPLQIGTTNGGNDGSTFTRFGVPDVAIGWPLRYSHSPAEVMDLADLLALADITRAIAEAW